MTPSRSPLPIAVVGGGAVGLVAALALARAGLAIAHVAPPTGPLAGRTVALFDGSIRLLRSLGVWSAIEPLAAPLEQLALIDDTDSLFRPPPVTFAAGEIGLDAFGWNVDLNDLLRILAAALKEEERVGFHATTATGFVADQSGATITLASGESLAASLVIAADGGKSAIRLAAGVATREWSYPQTALTTIVAHGRRHGFVSTEFHTRQGPFTFVPMPGRRSSLVWVTTPDRAAELHAMPDADLSRAIETQSHSFLGAMRIDGPRGLIPLRGLSSVAMSAPGVMLAGEAAHVFPPIGAQGLNLGLRDAAHLVDILCDARAAGTPFDDARLRSRYEHARRLDVAMRSHSVDWLNRTLLTDFLPFDALRGVGLLALDQIGPLRRFVMRMGVAPPGQPPRLMRPAMTLR